MFDTEQAQEAFLKEYGISHEMVRRSMTTWSGLDEIVSDYTSMKDKYEEIADKYTSAFRKIRQVNSIRSRVKDSEHLVGKIIRKNADRGSDRAYLIDTSNYKKYITDLVGVRVLLLFQNDWEMIHDHIMEYCLEDILVDIARLKYFHDIKYVNEIKLMAYIASWILKRKPFQLIEGCDSKFIYINEKFALSILVQTVGLNNPDMFYRDENRESIVRNMDAIFYHLKYRNTNPQTLELLLMGIQTGMMMEK